MRGIVRIFLIIWPFVLFYILVDFKQPRATPYDSWIIQLFLYVFVNFTIVFICMNIFTLGELTAQIIGHKYPNFEKWLKNEQENNFTRKNTDKIENKVTVLQNQASKNHFNIQLPDSWSLNEYYVGIYRITNIVNGKVYIGESINVQTRWQKHFYDLRNKIHHNYLLQKDFNIYPESSFLPELLERIEYTNYKETKKILLQKERMYILAYRNKGIELYNSGKEYLDSDEHNLTYNIKHIDILENNKNVRYDFKSNIEIPEVKIETKNINILDSFNTAEYHKKIILEEKYKRCEEKDFVLYVKNNFSHIKKCVVKGNTIEEIYDNYFDDIEKNYFNLEEFIKTCQYLYHEDKLLRHKDNDINVSQMIRNLFLIILFGILFIILYD